MNRLEEHAYLVFAVLSACLKVSGAQICSRNDVRFINGLTNITTGPVEVCGANDTWYRVCVGSGSASNYVANTCEQLGFSSSQSKWLY